MTMSKLILSLLIASLCLTSAQEPSRTKSGFALPEPGHTFSFPRDFGSHPDFKIEWWYVTGHLFSEEGSRFGFQATFFRSAVRPIPPGATESGEDFGSNNLFVAHMALLDVKTGRFIHQQRLNREGWNADSSVDHLDVRNGNWFLCMTNNQTQAMCLRGSVQADVSYELTLEPEQPLVVFGENSVSRKAEDPTAASYYLTFPKLAANGVVVEDGKTYRVHGGAWMDHEISSSQLGHDQAGWDWCCLQLNGGREIMAYRLRRKNGAQDPYSMLAWVQPDGGVTNLHSSDFSMEPIRTWKSPHSGAVYPVSMRLRTRDPRTNQKVVYTLEPLAEDQELSQPGGFAYWEGACRIKDSNGNEVGSAFLELTGYSGDLQKELRPED